MSIQRETRNRLQRPGKWTASRESLPLRRESPSSPCLRCSRQEMSREVETFRSFAGDRGDYWRVSLAAFQFQRGCSKFQVRERPFKVQPEGECGTRCQAVRDLVGLRFGYVKRGKRSDDSSIEKEFMRGWRGLYQKVV